MACAPAIKFIQCHKRAVAIPKYPDGICIPNIHRIGAGVIGADSSDRVSGGDIDEFVSDCWDFLDDPVVFSIRTFRPSACCVRIPDQCWVLPKHTAHDETKWSCLQDNFLHSESLHSAGGVT